MKKETIIDNEYATLWYYPDAKIVHHQLHKYVYGENFRNVLLTGSQLLEKHGAYKWLSDDRGSAAVTKEDMKWAKEYWTPETIRLGWRYWAIIVPKSVIGQMAYTMMIEELKKIGVEVKVFSDPESGLAWLTPL